MRICTVRPTAETNPLAAGSLSLADTTTRSRPSRGSPAATPVVGGTEYGGKGGCSISTLVLGLVSGLVLVLLAGTTVVAIPGAVPVPVVPVPPASTAEGDPHAPRSTRLQPTRTGTTRVRRMPIRRPHPRPGSRHPSAGAQRFS